MTTPTTVQVRLQIRADTAANWTSVNPILLTNELGLESDTKKFKIGNGTSAWVDLAYFPSIVSGGTVLGNLEIGTTGTLTFEGSTANGFETTLGVVDPTADRTILLPNQSGTVVVGGNASIVDADIAANAEIAVSKLADGAARQLLQTDAAGTGVEWTSNIDIPGTLDVTGVATFDGAVTVAGDLTVNGTTTTISTQNLLVEDKNIILGDVATPTDVTADGGGITLKGATDKTINWIDSTDAWTSSERFSVPLGSAAAPSLTFTGDENTGIYSPGADQVAISTGGTGRLFVDASGRIGTGIAPVYTNHIKQNTTYGFGLEASANDSRFLIGNVSSTWRVAATYDTGGSYQDITVFTSDLERLRITSTGLVGVGNSTPESYNSAADDLVVGNHVGAHGITVCSQNNSSGYIMFADGTTGPQPYAGQITYDHTNNRLTLGTNDGTTGLTVDSLQRVGVGTTSPGATLDVNGNIRISSAVGLEIASSSNSTITHKSGGSSTAYYTYLDASRNYIWQDNATERMRIDSSGRVGIGTSNVSALFHVAGDSSDGTQARITGATNQNYQLRWGFDTTNLAGRIQSIHVGTAYRPLLLNPDGGSVGIGTTSASKLLHLAANDGNAAILLARSNSGAASLGQVGFATVNGTVAGIDATAVTDSNNGTLRFWTTGGSPQSDVTTLNSSTPRMVITSAGLVGIGTNTIRGTSLLDARGDISFGSNASYYGLLSYNAGSGHLESTSSDGGFKWIRASGPATSMTLDSSGRLGIGTTPDSRLHVQGLGSASGYTSANNAGVKVDFGTGSNGVINLVGGAELGVYRSNSSGAYDVGIGFGDNSNRILRFDTAGTERAHIDSSGRLLVGTSSSPSAGLGQYALAVVQGYAGSTTGEGILSIARGKAATALVNTDTVGQIAFTDNAGNTFAKIVSFVDGTVSSTSDLPGALSFSTTADGASSPTPRMGIYSNGTTGIFTTNAGSLFFDNSAGAGTTYEFLLGRYGATGLGSGTASFRVWTNGNVVNTNNSYGALSDIKLKENIVDANSQWDDLKALQVRNYNFKEGQTHTQIGLVAQEVELVSPGLVTESPDRDAEGNDLGTVTKSVNYSVLYMKAVKALQEAMERIETLEAKVAALETP